MNSLQVAKREIGETLELLVANRSRIGEFDWQDLVPDVAAALKRAAVDTPMLADEAWIDVAHRLTRDFIRARSPVVPNDSAQLALFYAPDALLTLGGREVIAMRDCEAPHLERHRVVLTNNFQAQSGAYFAWMGYIDDRLPKLRAQGGTLAAIELEQVEA